MTTYELYTTNFDSPYKVTPYNSLEEAIKAENESPAGHSILLGFETLQDGSEKRFITQETLRTASRIHYV